MAASGFRRRRDGRVVLVLQPDEIAVLQRIAADVASLVESPPDDDVGARLYPRAYLDPTADEAEHDFRELVHDDLMRKRLAALAAITDAPNAGSGRRGAVEIVLEPEAEAQWVAALNDARLVVGTILGVTEEEPGDYKRGDPRFEHGVLYQWLSLLQAELVDLLLGDIGEAGAGDDIDLA